MISEKPTMKEKLKKELKRMIGVRLTQSDINRMDLVTANRSEFLRVAGMKEVSKREKDIDNECKALFLKPSNNFKIDDYENLTINNKRSITGEDVLCANVKSKVEPKSTNTGEKK